MSQWWILSTGCTAVLKPAEDASLSSLRMAELLMEAGMPAGVISWRHQHGDRNWPAAAAAWGAN